MSLTTEQLEARKRELLAQEATQPEQWYYLSFAGKRGFLGAVLTRARGLLSAVHKTRSLGINPGGQIASWSIPNTTPPDKLKIIAAHCDRLLSKDDLVSIFGPVENLAGEVYPPPRGRA